MLLADSLVVYWFCLGQTAGRETPVWRRTWWLRFLVRFPGFAFPWWSTHPSGGGLAARRGVALGGPWQFPAGYCSSRMGCRGAARSARTRVAVGRERAGPRQQAWHVVRRQCRGPLDHTMPRREPCSLLLRQGSGVLCNGEEEQPVRDAHGVTACASNG